MVLLDKIVFSLGVFALVIGLLFEASGFGAFVAGHTGGLLLVVIGVSMYWAGWVISGAQAFSCAVAAALNMFDAASTLAFWNFEVNYRHPDKAINDSHYYERRCRAYFIPEEAPKN